MEIPFLPLDYLLYELPPELGPLECLTLGLASRGLYQRLILQDKRSFNGAVLVCRFGTPELREHFVRDKRFLASSEYWIHAPTLEVYFWYARRDPTRWQLDGLERMVPHFLIRDRTYAEDIDYYLGHHIWGNPPKDGVKRITMETFHDEVKKIARLYHNKKVLELARLGSSSRRAAASKKKSPKTYFNMR